MKMWDSTHALEIDRVLAAREEEVCAILRAHDAVEPPGAGNGIDDATAEYAALELEDILAARRRLVEGTYGVCRDCGNSIDAGYLETVPATSYCSSCAALHETAGAGYHPP